MTRADVDDALARVRAGDLEAYAEVVRAHQADVWRVVAYALPGGDGTADLVQQAFIEAYDGLDRFEAGRDFGKWVRGIARNLARQELRRRAREGRRMDAYREHLEVVADGDEDADAREKAMREALERCRQGLSEPAQRALELRYRRGQSFGEIAEALDRTVAAARQLLQRVRLQLRSCIETNVEAS